MRNFVKRRRSYTSYVPNIYIIVTYFWYVFPCYITKTRILLPIFAKDSLVTYQRYVFLLPILDTYSLVLVRSPLLRIKNTYYCYLVSVSIPFSRKKIRIIVT